MADTTAPDWTAASIGELITHLVSTHHEATRRWCAELEELGRIQGGRVGAAASLLARELLAHQEQEERATFPLSIALEAACHDPALPLVDAAPAIHQMAVGHAHWAPQVAQLQRLVGISEDDAPQAAARTAPPDPAEVVRRERLRHVCAALVSDLERHRWLEEQVLLPAVLFYQDLLASRRAAATRPTPALRA